MNKDRPTIKDRSALKDRPKQEDAMRYCMPHSGYDPLLTTHDPRGVYALRLPGVQAIWWKGGVRSMLQKHFAEKSEPETKAYLMQYAGFMKSRTIRRGQKTLLKRPMHRPLPDYFNTSAEDDFFQSQLLNLGRFFMDVTGTRKAELSFSPYDEDEPHIDTSMVLMLPVWSGAGTVIYPRPFTYGQLGDLKAAENAGRGDNALYRRMVIPTGDVLFIKGFYPEKPKGRMDLSNLFAAGAPDESVQSLVHCVPKREDDASGVPRVVGVVQAFPPPPKL